MGLFTALLSNITNQTIANSRKNREIVETIKNKHFSSDRQLRWEDLGLKQPDYQSMANDNKQKKFIEKEFYNYNQCEFILPNGDKQITNLNNAKITRYDSGDVIKFKEHFEFNLNKENIKNALLEYGFDDFDSDDIVEFQYIKNLKLESYVDFHMFTSDEMDYVNDDGSFGRSYTNLSDMQLSTTNFVNLQITNDSLQTYQKIEELLKNDWIIEAIEAYVFSKISFKVDTKLVKELIEVEI